MDRQTLLAPDPKSVAVQGIGLALFSHLIFKNFEPLALVFLTWLGVLITGHLTLMNKDVRGFDLSTVHILPTIELSVIYLATLSLSIAIYRLVFNPLRIFPGDTLAALTKWQNFQVVKHGQTHHFLWDQHKRHGDYVRIGPNELSVSDVEALPIIHGNKSKFPKGPWYWKAFMEPEPGLFSVLDWNEHKNRRKIWDSAIGAKALKSYEPAMLKHLETLCKRLDTFSATKEVVDMSMWVEYMAFDIMGELGFGAQFHMLESGKSHAYVDFVRNGLDFMSAMASISWAMPIVSLIPMDKDNRSKMAQFFEFGRSQFKIRLAEGSKKDDVFGYLLSAREGELSGIMTDEKLESDARNVLSGGGETTALLMTYLLFYLTQNKSAWRKLKASVKDYFHDEPFDAAKLGSHEYMNACINEALRMVPPGPNGMQRMVNTPGGIVLREKHIPEGTKISVHGWTVHHDPRNFGRPLEYIPERWIEGSDFKGVHNISAFIPFSQGTYQCVGRRLALQEARTFLFKMAEEYDFEYAPGFDQDNYIRQTKSGLTITKGYLPLVVSRVKA